MRSFFLALFLRDLRLAARRRADAWLPLGFFVVALALFPIGVGPEPQTLRAIAPGLVWVCALLSSMSSAAQLYASDHADGTLEQLMLSGHPSWLVALARASSHWVLAGLPLVVGAPLAGAMFDLPAESIGMLTLSLLLGTPILSLLGSVGAALALGLRSAGVLVILIVLPLSVPALIFGTGAVASIEVGQSAAGHCSMLGALLILTALAAPLAGGAALRIAVE